MERAERLFGNTKNQRATHQELSGECDFMSETQSRSPGDLARAAATGDRQAAADLLPLVYDELRRLAQSRLAQLPPGNTLQATALVHEAFVKLVGKCDPGWEGKAHFFGAAAEAMRQLLVDQARRKKSVKHGGAHSRIDIESVDVPVTASPDEVLAVDAALKRLQIDDPRKGQILALRCFAGFTRDEVAAAIGVSPATVDREWRYIIARLQKELKSAECQP